MTYRKKLIEVALPLDAINKESAREKSIRHGHPSTLHLWWARRPLAACRAVLFASLVDDPSNDLPEEEAKVERDRLFGILEELVKWENSNNENVLGRARKEILRSTGGNPPPVLDPFCGGGSIPLEAQRLGLEAHGSDLNPVAVLITKALIEIPPKFAGEQPVNPESRKTASLSAWRGAQGLAEDVRYYGKWMRDEAEKRIGHLYPKGPDGKTVIAWLWARTVRCPNPACGAAMPLVRSFWLSNKKGKKAWVQPVVDHAAKEVRFEVKTGDGVPQDGTMKNRVATCVVCGEVSALPYIRAEAQDGRMGNTLLAFIVEAQRGRKYQSPDSQHELVARSAQPKWKPEEKVTTPSHDVDRLPMYGMYTWGDAFTPRQLVALTTFSDLVDEARDLVMQDAVAASYPNERVPLNDSDEEARVYADGVATYLAFAVDRGANYWSRLTPWGGDFIVQTFGRQAIPMVWDHAEANPFSHATGNWDGAIAWITTCLERALPVSGIGSAKQADATLSVDGSTQPVISTDPPYYDNVGYADLADYFYVWLRHSLREIYPDLFSTMLVPKSAELVAMPHRFGGSRQEAKVFFEEGLRKAFDLMRKKARADYPLTVFYAFKQSESESDDDGTAMVASTGWETMLEGLLAASFQITGTWPMRTERDQGLKTGTNVLASSILMVCRPRSEETPPATRQEFVRTLRRELPEALSVMMAENIAPVDLAQATIGPGMAIYSRYSKVIEADGSPMRVRTALQIINQALDERLSEAEGDVDSHTRFAITWFEQHGMGTGPFPDAEGIAKARNVSVRGVVDAGILEARAGKVRLLPRESLTEKWNPATDRLPTDWEVVQYLIRALETEGETGAARLLARVGERGEGARDLAYRLYGICERKKWAEEALAYNGLVVSWPEITRLVSQNPSGTEPQTTMDF